MSVNLNIEENMQNTLSNMSTENMTPEEKYQLLLNKIASLEREVKEKDAIVAAAVRENKRYKESERRRRKEEAVKGKKLAAVKKISLEYCRKCLNNWRGERTQQYNTAEKLYKKWKNTRNKTFAQILKAVPKSGKRIIAEIISLMFYNDCYNENKEQCIDKNLDATKYVTPIHITGFNRNDCKNQLIEMRELGFYSEAASSKKSSCQLLSDYTQKERLDEGDRIRYAIVFIDEADYASGRNMKMEPWIKEWKGNTIFISATPEEVIAGYDLTTKLGDNYTIVNFKPSPLFKDKKWFYDNNLIFKPEPFTYVTNPKPLNFEDLSEEEKVKYKEEELDISEHGKNIIFECQQEMEKYKNQVERRGDRKHGGRNVVMTRKVPNKSGSYSNMKYKLKRTTQMKTTNGIIHDKHITSDGIEHDIKYKMVFVDGSNEQAFELDNAEHWERECAYDCVLLLFVCNSASRSTELAQPKEEKGIKYKGAHWFLYAFHDERILENTSNYNTIAQAIGRVNHYDLYGHPIKLYVCSLTCRIEAEIGTSWKLEKAKLPNISSRCNKRDSESSSSDNEQYSHKPTNRSAYYNIDGKHTFEPKNSFNRDDIAYEPFVDEKDAKNRIKDILNKAFPEKRFNVGFNKKHLKDGFYEERLLGHNNVGKYKVYSCKQIFESRGDHSSGDARKTYKTHICYEDPEDPTTIRYVICYPKSHLSVGVVESKSGD